MKLLLRSMVFLVCVSIALSTIGCNPDQLKRAKVAGQAIEKTADAVLQLIPTYEQSGELSHDEAQEGIRLLTDFKTTIHTFNSHAATYTTFDEHAKADLLKLFQDVTAGIATLNEQGVLRIKNPKLRGRVQIYLAATQVTLSVIASALEN